MFEELHTLSESEQLKSEIMMMPAFDASIMSRMLSNIDTQVSTSIFLCIPSEENLSKSINISLVSDG
ncbi:hypothetical protein [Vibrio crassostreae]|uniref:hypothetical protein n=1 Tax=Vibrio crassostreae TaxID=246167 RepID=UPI001FB34FB1|nr:hypothetical protein [Vibrio crassostreae]